MFSGPTRFLTKVIPCSTQGLSAASSGLEIDDGDALRIDVDVPQQNGQRAPRDRAETDEQNSMGKVSMPSALSSSADHFNFFTSTLEFRPLCSYFSRRAGGRSSGVPSDKTPFGLKIREGLRR